ncbi:YbfB/YjiJ family MFS transporter [Aliamphritea ceti]|uniref:YbfB/YjiJ family MFS transporter n=1 Tax=Aliamphritea ceti TaxID=1524258 RepID=UPI0021C3BBEA|nr:YbfB/YjiJ family MFS transporter [Aliamphritea ceti]
MLQFSEKFRVLAAGVLGLVITMGVARFAYTPLLGIMQQHTDLSLAAGGWLAALNYVGYLSGAIIASLISDLQLKDRLFRLGLLVAVATTLMMGLSDDLWVWAVSRFFAGLSSAAGMLLGSGLVLNWLLRNGQRGELGIHFGGIGLGIACCAILVEVTVRFADWQQQWYLLTLLALVLTVLTWRWMPAPDTSGMTTSGKPMPDNPPGKLFFWVFMAAYFCAGIGYAVSATFISAIVEALPGMQGQGSITFMLVGLGAMPACFIWDRIARSTGDVYALLLACLLQIIGIMLPLFGNSLWFALSGAALFGATFVGMVSLVLAMAGRYYPTRPAKMMGRMTISYGVAQIVAPAATGWLAGSSGSYAQGLYLAAGMMLLGAVLLVWLKLLERHQSKLQGVASSIS